jgi:hypothetical protein
MTNENTTAEKIATETEVSDLSTVNRANEEANRSVVVHLSDALHFVQDIKLLSSNEPELARGFRDLLWRASDAVQQEIECALGHISQDELDAWHDTKD